MALAKAGFVLGIKAVSVLRPHEETIPLHVTRLASEMKRDGVQKDPIIIDKESATVLDGMHRLAALRTLHVGKIVCCSVDYSSGAVAVGRWARVYTLPWGDSVSEALRRAGIDRRTPLSQALDSLDNRDIGLAAFTATSAFLPQGKFELGQATKAIEELDRISEEQKWKRRFVPEDEIDASLQSEANIVLLMRRLGKDDVVTAARSGRLFPCKTSMHRIDPRPVAVNFPLRGLDGATTATLRRTLSGRGERLLPPGSLYEGRRYKERLLLLNQE